MKTNKILKLMGIILLIILIVIVSFVGIYVKEKNKMVNLVKDYSLGMDFEGSRLIILSPDTTKETKYYDEEGQEVDTSGLSEEELEKYTKQEIAVNPTEVLNDDNYEKAKNIIEKRLTKVGVDEYTISKDSETGNILLQILEKERIDDVLQDLFMVGKFEIKDKDTNEVLMNNSDIDSVNVAYYPTETGTTVYLTIQFNKDGTKKFADITTTYVESTNDEGDRTTKNILLSLDGEDIIDTYFTEEITTGELQLSIGQETTDMDLLQDYILSASTMSVVLENGKLPITYGITTNKTISSTITEESRVVASIALLIIATTMIAYIIAEYKERGIIAGVSFVGFIALLLLVARYTDIVLTLEGVIAIILISIFYYIFLITVLNKMKTYKSEGLTPKYIMERAIYKYMLIALPVFIISIVCCFTSYLRVSSFGIVMFWGILAFTVYTFLITKTMMLDYEYLYEEEE